MLKWQISYFVILKMTLQASSEIWSLIAITAAIQILNDTKSGRRREMKKKTGYKLKLSRRLLWLTYRFPYKCNRSRCVQSTVIDSSCAQFLRCRYYCSLCHYSSCGHATNHLMLRFSSRVYIWLPANICDMWKLIQTSHTNGQVKLITMTFFFLRCILSHVCEQKVFFWSQRLLLRIYTFRVCLFIRINSHSCSTYVERIA